MRAQSAGAEVGPAAERSVLDLIEATAARTPSAPAVVSGQTRLTYGELDKAADRLAHRLLAAGVEAQTCVGILMERSAAAVVAVLAVWKAGAAHVPLDVDSPDRRRRQILADAGVRMVLTDAALSSELAGASVAAASVETAVETASVETLVVDLAALTADDRPPLSRPDRSIGPASLAYVIYTSGSSGRPKGVMATHGGLLGNHLAWETAFGLRGNIRAHAQMANFAFDGFLGELVRGLCSGAALVVFPRELVLQPAQLLESLRAEGIDVADFVPPVLRALAEHAEKAGESLAFLKTVIVGSDAYPAADLARVARLAGPGTKVVNCYGLTEGTIDSTYFVVSPEQDYGDAVMIGLPLPGTEAHILDEDLRPVPPGAIGTLYIAGSTLTRGYLGDPGKTAGAFIPHPFSGRSGERMYRTGDQARYRQTSQGPQIEFIGRRDRQVQLRGYRVELGEVEAALRGAPGVRAVAVVCDDDDPARLRLAAYLLAEPGSETTDWIALARESLPRYMVPARIVLVSALPMTVNGKVDYAALKNGAGTEVAPAAARPTPVAASTRTEERVVELFRDVLLHPGLGVADDFFESGGDSLGAMQIIAQIRREWGVQSSVRDFFKSPTAKQVAAEVDRQLSQGNVRPASFDLITPAFRETVEYAEE
ncbi:non-ribosomal peptide synthetase [Catenulispora pinisilvae]|uniref:non-ribosomal peptide synthetase n=1 Tax=Catenulispora pinisilvae TaxID=2705253 RepID=UPI0018925077|nr:non-ribosomal peptide synthetase [Catenulispora pinisilvae]